MKHSQHLRAFTLIELMAVILIMAIMITVGALSLPRMGKQLAVARAGQQVLNAIEYARQLAITQRVPTAMWFKDNRIAVGMKNVFYASTAIYGSETWIPDRLYMYDGRNSTLPKGAVFLYPRGGDDGGPQVAGWQNNYSVGFAGYTGHNLPHPYGNVRIGTALRRGYGNDYLIRFDRFGTPDITTTLILTETSSKTARIWWAADMPNFTSSNRFHIALTKGSREIRSWR